MISPLLLVGWTLAALPAPAASQCLSRNDHKFLTKDPDLFPLAPFSLGLFRELAPPKGNFVLSPFSVWSALVVAYFGTGGNTEVQLRRTLQLNGKENALALYKCVDEIYASEATKPNNTFSAASRIYVQEGSPLKACVRGALKEELDAIDFQQPDLAAATINAFVSRVTRGKIPQAVTSPALGGARVVLVNAAHFEGVWEEPFLPENTRREIFFASRGQQLQVDMMTQRNLFKLGSSQELGARVLEMAYRGGTASMFVFLPLGQQDLNQMLLRLNPTTFLAAITSTRAQEVDLSFPKFRVETVIQRDLLTVLTRMGINDLFKETSDLTTFFAGGGRHRLDWALHTAALKVDERGASSAAIAGASSAPASTQEPVPFRCDRPFAFLVYDNVNRNILFAGVFRLP
ncbi:leukocyte elastase inhibitor-like [Penaeus monodon]|uniref:leukocyte elastase inhibitor-like n=1 Tax=Penaeus monodon TaxID=6687 RepID=UPI0018A6F4EF|nr:leukocyte elastase inhibitor-like [Penaeus monodon]XP_037790874.1 leukocyte elastase inhibitor-like [Penaeus monodon]